MSRDDIREALLLLEEPAEASAEFRQNLLQRFIAEASSEEKRDVPKGPSRLRRPRWLRVRMVPAVAVVVTIALLSGVFLLFPRPKSAWAALERARDRFERRPFHATISNSAAVFDADLNTIMETEVVEHWFESETRWRSTTLNHNLDPHLAGSFSVTDGEKLGRYFSENNTFTVQSASEIDDLYLSSGLTFLDPRLGSWATSAGIKPTKEFLDENCEVSEDSIADRSADRLICKTGLEGDTIREASFWLDRETGFILKLTTLLCGTVEGERRCGQEAVREVKSIEFDPTFPEGIFDVKPPEGATVREESGAQQPAPGAINVDVDPSRIAAGFGSVWVSGDTSTDREEFRRGPGRLLRIDPGHNTIVATIDEVESFALGEDFVWVLSAADGAVFLRRLDPDTNGYTGPRIPVGEIEPQDLAVGEGAVWVAGANGEGAQRRAELLRIDPATNQVRRVELEQMSGTVAAPDFAPSGISLGAGAVWVNVSYQPSDHTREPINQVQKVDAESLELQGTIRPSTRVVSEFGEGALWMLTRGGRTSTLTKIDPHSLQEVGRIDLPPDPHLLTTQFGLVWVLSYEAHTLTKIDAKGLRILGEPIVYGSQGGQAFAIADGNRTAWVGMWAGIGRGTLVRIDVRASSR